MKQTILISLLILLLSPIIWNGVTFFHYLVEHTHTFCQKDTTHNHSDTNECLSIFQLTENQHHKQLPSPKEIEFKEIKQFLTSNLYFTPITEFSFREIPFIDIGLPDHIFSEDIFHPPILT